MAPLERGREAGQRELSRKMEEKEGAVIEEDHKVASGEAVKKCVCAILTWCYILKRRGWNG